MMKNFSKIQRILIFVAFLGLLDSVYLLIIKVTANKAFCIQGVGDCWSVNTSTYSEINGIPIAWIGAAAYLTILVLVWLEYKNLFFTEYGPLIIFGLTLTGLIYSIYLTYIEFAVIKAVCPFCVLSAICILILFLFSIPRLNKIQAVNKL